MSIEKDTVSREITFKPDLIDDEDRKVRVIRERDEGQTSISVWVDDRLVLMLDDETAENDALEISRLLDDAAGNSCLVEKK